MKNTKKRQYSIAFSTITTVIILVLTSLFTSSYAQTYEEARNFAFNGERAKARQICKTILLQSFNSDVALLLGRTYAWDGKYDSTRLILNEVLPQPG